METGRATHWQCLNRECGWSLAKLELGDEDGAPRCICGQEMRPGPAPAPDYLGFLREERSAVPARGEERE